MKDLILSDFLALFAYWNNLLLMLNLKKHEISLNSNSAMKSKSV